MIGFLLAIILLSAALANSLLDAFLANPILNGLILGVLVLGIVYVFGTVFVLAQDVRWHRNFVAGRPLIQKPRVLAPLATILGEPEVSLTALSMRSLLDGIASRLDEARDISRYLIGLLIFLGLLGTFWGLLQTLGGVREVIGNLSISGGSLQSVFSDLKNGLQAPLVGMGTAFSSSLFGLAGSLILGFLELQAGQAQNRFFNDLEDWLSQSTHIGPVSILTEAEQPVPAYVQALLEKTADNLEHLQRLVQRGEESRVAANETVIRLSETVTRLADQMSHDHSLISQLTESHKQVQPALSAIETLLSQDSLDRKTNEKIHEHIRAIDLQMTQLIEETSRGRQAIVDELRAELRVLTRTIAGMNEFVE